MGKKKEMQASLFHVAIDNGVIAKELHAEQGFLLTALP